MRKNDFQLGLIGRKKKKAKDYESYRPDEDGLSNLKKGQECQNKIQRYYHTIHEGVRERHWPRYNTE